MKINNRELPGSSAPSSPSFHVFFVEMNDTWFSETTCGNNAHHKRTCPRSNGEKKTLWIQYGYDIFIINIKSEWSNNLLSVIVLGNSTKRNGVTFRKKFALQKKAASTRRPWGKKLRDRD